MLQCYFSLLDSKFGHEAGTSESHLDAGITMIQHADQMTKEFAHSTKNIHRNGSKLESIIESANSLARSFFFETAQKPSTWSEPAVVQRREFCQKALDFAKDSLSMMGDIASNSEEKGFGAGGARGEKRALEDEEENETGNEKGPKRRRMVSPPRLRHRRR